MSTSNRTRTSNSSVPTFRTEVFTYVWPPYGHSNVFQRSFTGSVSTVTDVVTPNFRKIQKAGGIVLSPVNVSRTTRSFSSGSQSASTGSSWAGSMSGDMINMLQGVPELPNMNVTSVSTNALLLQAIAKAKSAGVLSGEIAAEFGATLRMLRRPFSGATNLIAEIATRKNWYLQKKKSMTAIKAAASAWLEKRYGWNPLISDCSDIVRTINSQHENIVKRRLVSRAGSSVTNKSSQSWPIQVNSGGGRASEGRVSREIKTSVNVGIIYEIINRSTSAQIARALGLDATSLPATVYELMPFSFVADWFTNIGTWIQASTPDPSMSVLGNWVTTVSNSDRITSGTSSRPSNVPAGDQWWEGSYGSETVNQFDYVRVINQLVTYSPEVTNIVPSLLHTADGLALIAQRLVGSLGPLRH